MHVDTSKNMHIDTCKYMHKDMCKYMHLGTCKYMHLDKCKLHIGCSKKTFHLTQKDIDLHKTQHDRAFLWDTGTFFWDK